MNTKESPEVIRLPRMSDSMTHGKIVKWHFQVGDRIKPGDVIAEIETDKATMELDSYEHGTVLYLSVNEGEQVAVNGILAIVGNQGDDITHLITDNTTPTEDIEEKVDGFVGEVKMFAGEPAPSNWLLCNGKTYRTEDHPALFAQIGYQYGGGDNYFKVPNIAPQNGVQYIIFSGQPSL